MPLHESVQENARLGDLLMHSLVLKYQNNCKLHLQQLCSMLIMFRANARLARWALDRSLQYDFHQHATRSRCATAIYSAYIWAPSQRVHVKPTARFVERRHSCSPAPVDLEKARQIDPDSFHVGDWSVNTSNVFDTYGTSTVNKCYSSLVRFPDKKVSSHTKVPSLHQIFNIIVDRVHPHKGKMFCNCLTMFNSLHSCLLYQNLITPVPCWILEVWNVSAINIKVKPWRELGHKLMLQVNY